jgi:hypothetical protein
MLPIPQDTPIRRASIRDMNDAQLVDYVGELQVRRLKTWTIYQAGLKAKQEAASVKDQALLAKACERLFKEHEKVLKSLEKMEKLALDVQALRLTLGDLG